MDRAAAGQGIRDRHCVPARGAPYRRFATPFHRVRRVAARVAAHPAGHRRRRRGILRAGVRTAPFITMRIDPQTIEDVAKELYIRALKILPPDVKQGFAALAARETGATAQSVLGTMIRNIAVAEETDNLLCQDTGIPIYNITVGRGVRFDDGDGTALKAAIRKGCERATREHPLRSSIVHPLTRKNEHTSCGIGVPVINIDHGDDVDGVRVEMIPKGSGSENNSWLKMALPAEGVD